MVASSSQIEASFQDYCRFMGHRKALKLKEQGGDSFAELMSVVGPALNTALNQAAFSAPGLNAGTRAEIERPLIQFSAAVSELRHCVSAGQSRLDIATIRTLLEATLFAVLGPVILAKFPAGLIGRILAGWLTRLISQRAAEHLASVICEWVSWLLTRGTPTSEKVLAGIASRAAV